MTLCCLDCRFGERMADNQAVPARADNFSVRINKQINEDIKLEKKRLRNRTKMLLLGCGEAGKVGDR